MRSSTPGPLTLLLTTLLALGCGSGRTSFDGPLDAGHDAGSDSGSDTTTRDTTASPDIQDTSSIDTATAQDTSDATASDTAADLPDTTPPPTPQDLGPCDAGTCWDTSIAPTACRDDAIDENFSSGNYNVHRYATTLPAHTDTVITLASTAGTWAPALVIADRDGLVLSDGEITRIESGLTVTLHNTGRSSANARITLRSDTPRPIDVFVTGWSVIDSNFVDFLTTNATYTLTVESLCDTPYLDCVVNGHTVAEPACGWLNHIGRDVVPRLSGSRDQRLTDASRVAWWALKEGVLFLDNPIVYSNCNFSSGDARIGPLDTCPDGRAWQVGLSAVQVPYVATLAELEALSTQLYPNLTSSEVLTTTALEAGLTGDDVTTVANSTGYLRQSWLLRNSAIGFTEQVPPVTSECIDQSLSWCYGTGWNATALYAPTRAGAMQSMSDIRDLFDQLAP